MDQPNTTTSQQDAQSAYNPTFDPVEYINTNFPNEESLASLDTHISNLRQDLDNCNNEIMQSIQAHALLTFEIEEEVKKSKNNVSNIISGVKMIREKAVSSEAIVKEISKDIQPLDLAKRNLSFSIESLKKFILLYSVIDRLADFCEIRGYREVSGLLVNVEEISQFFKPFDKVFQIESILKEKERIVGELKAQLREDFVAWGQNSAPFGKETIVDAAKLIETLGVNFQNEIIKLISDVVLKPYDEEFTKMDSWTLEYVERRYPWIQRRIREIEVIYDEVFPHYWGMKCSIYQEFCKMTRDHITNILENQPVNDVEVLMKALQATLKFEAKLKHEIKKEFNKYIPYEPNKESPKKNHDEDLSPTKAPSELDSVDDNKSELTQDEEVKVNDVKPENQGEEPSEPQLIEPEALQEIPQESRQFVLPCLPKFKGSISEGFEQYMKPYTDMEEKEIKDNIYDAFNSNDEEYDPHSDQRELYSSLVMFNNFSSVLKRAKQYSRTQTMFDVWKVFKRVMKFYTDQVLIKLGNEDKKKAQDESRFQIYACMVINTGDYCKETVFKLGDKVKQCLDSPFCDELSVDSEEQMFTTMIHEGIAAVLTYIDKKTDTYFSSITSTNWEKIGEVGDASQYVKQTVSTLTSNIQQIKPVIVDNYFIYYLNKLADLIQTKFITYLTKIKKIGDMGVQKLQLDAYELKTALGNLIKVGYESQRKMSNAAQQKPYLNTVSKKFQKVENILKLAAMTKDQFSQNWKNFFDSGETPEVIWLMQIKGLVKGSQSDILSSFFKH